MTYAEYATAASEALCELHTRCGDATVFSATTACRTDREDPAPSWLAAGTVCLDPDAAERCLALLRGDCYAITLSFARVCLQVLRPLLGGGAACVANEECLSNICVQDASCAGTCARAAGEGDACDTGARCVAGLRCLDGTCEPPGAEGASCRGHLGCQVGLGCLSGRCQPFRDELERCSSPLECRPELYCLNPYADGSCRPRPGEGEACSEDQCAAGFTCGAGACRRTSGPGEVCEGACPPTFGCDADGRCVQLPLPGDACDTELGCADGDCVDGTCQLRQEGELCGRELHCAGYCDYDLVFRSECVGPRFRGEACENSAICDVDLVCRGGICDDPCPRTR